MVFCTYFEHEKQLRIVNAANKLQIEQNAEKSCVRNLDINYCIACPYRA